MPVVLSILLLFTVMSGDIVTMSFAQSGCTTAMVEEQMQKLYQSLVQMSFTNAPFQAGLLRAGFHDCATTNLVQIDSGCNGSLRNEKEVRNNLRLVPTIDKVVSTRNGLAPCVSYADAFLLGYAAAVKTAAGLSIVRLLVDPGRPRADVPDGVGDFGDTEGTVQLPSPVVPDSGDLIAFYAARQMTMEDLIISNVIGHAIGSVRARPADAVFPVNNFTAAPSEAGPLYAGHLLWRDDTGSETDLRGFTTLPSDQALVADPNGRALLEQYATFRLLGANTRHERIRFSWNLRQHREALRAFQRFSVKMSQLSGSIMRGDSSFRLPTDVDTLRSSTRGWDGPREIRLNPRDADEEVNPALSETSDIEKPWFRVGQDFFTFFNSK